MWSIVCSDVVEWFSLWCEEVVWGPTKRCKPCQTVRYTYTYNIQPNGTSVKCVRPYLKYIILCCCDCERSGELRWSWVGLDAEWGSGRRQGWKGKERTPPTDKSQPTSNTMRTRGSHCDRVIVGMNRTILFWRQWSSLLSFSVWRLVASLSFSL